MRVIDASLGFKSYVWEITCPDGEVVLVCAADNYTACEAAGYKFSVCHVKELDQRYNHEDETQTHITN